MNKFDNIKETREYQLAMQVEEALNNYSFDGRVFAAAIPMMHPTLQQSLYRLIKHCLAVMADEKRHYDDRNIASHNEAKAIIDYIKENGTFIPHI